MSSDDVPVKDRPRHSVVSPAPTGAGGRPPEPPADSGFGRPSGGGSNAPKEERHLGCCGWISLIIIVIFCMFVMASLPLGW